MLASGEGSFLRRGIGKQRLRFAITIHTELTKDAQKRFVAVSTFAILSRYRKQSRAAARPRFCAARVPAAACGRRPRVGPSGIAVMLSGGWDCLASDRERGQEARSGLRTRCAGLRQGQFSEAQDWRSEALG